MSYPRSELDRLPPWSLRLLERIQNTTATHARVLRSGFPAHDPGTAGSAVPVLSWRAHLRALESERTESEIHALATGISPEAIAWARAGGERGQQWSERGNAPPISGHREEPVRAHMVGGIAHDVWHLEHTAAVIAEYQHRVAQGQLPEDSATYQRLQRNLLAVWERADATAHAVELTPAEGAAIWGRDRVGWQHLVAVTVRGYDNAALVERWQIYGWPGLEHEAHRATANLAVHTPASQRAVSPPVVWRMIQDATDAIADTEPFAVGDRALERAVRAALPTDHAAAWDTEPDTGPTSNGARGRGAEPGNPE
ncbi:hypothetical protein [Nocardia sp. NPDC057227]|uniref:hypothetical protein n=1 Tax=Nocardia sp. NPDC057227 TaxID=3346056 RepID=UPI00363AB5BD